MKTYKTILDFGRTDRVYTPLTTADTVLGLMEEITEITKAHNRIVRIKTIIEYIDPEPGDDDEIKVEIPYSEELQHQITGTAEECPFDLGQEGTDKWNQVEYLLKSNMSKDAADWHDAEWLDKLNNKLKDILDIYGVKLSPNPGRTIRSMNDYLQKTKHMYRVESRTVPLPSTNQNITIYYLLQHEWGK